MHAAAVAGRSPALSIPTIGIGSGSGTDGQVLVLQDMLGAFEDLNLKFVRQYLPGRELILDALNRYDSEVKAGEFPGPEESYS